MMAAIMRKNGQSRGCIAWLIDHIDSKTRRVLHGAEEYRGPVWKIAAVGVATLGGSVIKITIKSIDIWRVS